MEYKVRTWLINNPPTMLIPRGLRELRSRTGGESERKGSKQRSESRHHDRPQPCKTSLFDCNRRCLTLRTARKAKSTIMIAFFLAIPINSSMPTTAIMLKIEIRHSQENQRAETC